MIRAVFVTVFKVSFLLYHPPSKILAHNSFMRVQILFWSKIDTSLSNGRRQKRWSFIYLFFFLDQFLADISSSWKFTVQEKIFFFVRLDKSTLLLPQAVIYQNMSIKWKFDFSGMFSKTFRKLVVPTTFEEILSYKLF